MAYVRGIYNDYTLFFFQQKLPTIVNIIIMKHQYIITLKTIKILPANIYISDSPLLLLLLSLLIL